MVTVGAIMLHCKQVGKSMKTLQSYAAMLAGRVLEKGAAGLDYKESDFPPPEDYVSYRRGEDPPSERYSENTWVTIYPHSKHGLLWVSNPTTYRARRTGSRWEIYTPYGWDDALNYSPNPTKKADGYILLNKN